MILAVSTAIGSLTAVSVSAAAATVSTTSLAAGDDFTYGNLFCSVLEDGTIKITGINDDVGSTLVIPAKIKGKKVTAVGGIRSTKLTSVTLPTGLKEISGFAFSGCGALKTINIPNTVTTIGVSAFNDCVNLTAPTIPQSVTKIDDAPFCNCPKITAVKISSKNKNYCVVNGVLFSKDKTRLVQYPNGKSGAYAIPSTVSTVSYDAFAHCTKLTKLSVPKNVTYLSYNGFEGCSNLSAINVNSQNRYYASVNGVLFDKNKENLYRYPQAKSGAYTVPSTVKYVLGYAFSDCTKLTKVIFPNSVKDIGASAFMNTGLASVTLPASLTKVDITSFLSCPKLKAIYVSTKNKYFSSIKGVVFNKKKTELLMFPSGKSGVYTVPTGTKTIGKLAFQTGNKVLTCVKLPSTVTTIKEDAFSNVENLRSLYFPKTIKTIGDFAFSGSNKLTDIYYAGTSSAWKKINISSYNSLLNYNISVVSNNLPAVSNVKASANKSAVTLTWNKNTKASYYKVFAKSYTGWKTLKKTKNNSVVKFTANDLYPGSTYIFRVNAYDKSNKLIACTDINATTVGNISSLSCCSRTKTALTLTWDKFYGSASHKVFVVENGKFKQLANLNDRATTYTATGLKTNTKYSFRVISYDKNNKIVAYNDISEKTLANISNLKAKPAKTSVKLTWSKNSSASSYTVYVVSNGKYKKLTTTTSLSYTAKSLKANTKYTFRVVAHNKSKSMVAFSNISTTTLK